MGEQAVLALREWTPCFRLDFVLIQYLLSVVLLVERMDFDLVDRRGDLVVKHEVSQSVGDRNC